MKGFYDITRLMVGMDLTETDDHLLRYIQFFSQVVKPEKIYFIHVHKDLDLPEELKKALYGSSKPYDELLRQEMEAKVVQLFPDHAKYQVEYLVVEGSPMPRMLYWSKIKDIDLMVIGRKQQQNSGMLLNRLTRRVRCSILIVPPRPDLLLENILVCNDFSENSVFAMEKALNLAGLNGLSTIYSQHIYAVPKGFYASGKSYSEFARIMKVHKSEKFEAFTKRFQGRGVQIVPIFTLDRKNDPPRNIIKTADSMQADMVVVGSRGRTRAAAMFLGSFAEKLVQDASEIPLMVVKRKNDTLHALEAIKQL